MNAYAAEALFKGPEHRVHLRTAQEGGVVWLDLADEESRAVRVDKEGWRVVSAGEVVPKFFRPPNMRPLPEPLPGEADASQLRKVLKVPDADTFQLLLTYLSFAILPNKPYPILAVSGPAGAAKSSFAEFVRTTIDPSDWPKDGICKFPSDAVTEVVLGVKSDAKSGVIHCIMSPHQQIVWRFG